MRQAMRVCVTIKIMALSMVCSSQSQTAETFGGSDSKQVVNERTVHSWMMQTRPQSSSPSDGQSKSATEQALDDDPTCLGINKWTRKSTCEKFRYDFNHGNWSNRKTFTKILKGTVERRLGKSVVIAIHYNGERDLLWLQMNEMYLFVDTLLVRADSSP